MVRRIFAIVLIVLGLGTIGAAVASGTIWRPDDQVTLTLPAAPDVPVVITAPGVLDAVDDEVDVRIVGATAETPLVLAMAPESDVRAWVADAAHWEITGLADWETLTYTDSRDEPTAEPSGSQSPTESGSATESPSASETPSETESATEPAEDETAEPESTVPNPSGSDLWVDEVDGAGELTYSWTAVPGRWVMLVATDGTEPAPQVELTWTRAVTTPFVQPGIILGSVVTLLGLGLLVWQLILDAERRRARRVSAVAADEPVTALAADGDRPLTRREIRLAEAQRRGGNGGRASTPATDQTASIPVVEADREPMPSQADGAEITEPATTPEAREPVAASDDADELDAWVRSGSASPLMHEGERTTPDDLVVEMEPEAAPEPASTPDPKPEPEPDPAAASQAREPWWRRRRSRPAEDEVAATQPEPTTEPSEQAEASDAVDVANSAHTATASGDTEQIPVVRADDDGDIPQVSGAFWRQTWGLGSDEPTPKEEEER